MRLIMAKSFDYLRLALVLGLLGCISSYATPKHEEYLSLLEAHPQALGPCGNHEKGEIEIITDPELMQQIERQTGREIGIVARDKYWIWINDPVLFPSGTYSVYGRFLWNHALQGITGVCAVPVDSQTGEIYLICQYRHSTRSWEIELPRGGCDPGETIFAAALRELKEETGLETSVMRQLGEIASDTGVAGSIVPLVYCEVDGHGEKEPEDTEAIEHVIVMTFDGCKQALRRGYLPVNIRGEVRLVPVRDPYLALALFHLE